MKLFVFPILHPVRGKGSVWIVARGESLDSAKKLEGVGLQMTKAKALACAEAKKMAGETVEVVK